LARLAIRKRPDIRPIEIEQILSRERLVVDRPVTIAVHKN
jgi:hypothetical protein